MSGNTDGLMLLTAPHLTAPHAFTTRAGGFSVGAYAAEGGGGGLNLDDRQDDPQIVARNRAHLAGALGLDATRYARLDQVHGTDVICADAPGHWTGDALVSAAPDVLLAIGTADCYPLLLHDPHAGVIGAAHAGWKGTLGRIAAHTVQAMVRLGAQPQHVRAAVGPGISAARYEVGEGVAAPFRDAGLAAFVQRRGSRTHLDLAGANRAALLEAGLSDGNIWVSGRCSTERDFYSYRRDHGTTGRMWAVIRLPAGGEA